ncbi:MAG: hypothetical protein DMF84_07845 [Acidobacteria bacterium]|nr:MAG: hypothetical protein DMF84_07845 [Acidobacteriota bacterium]
MVSGSGVYVDVRQQESGLTMGDSMSRRVYRVAFVCLLAVLAMGSSRVYGQGGTTSTLSGTVVDGSGAVLPGADVAVKHTATGVTQRAVTNGEGAFSIPSLNVGTYVVTVSLPGFKTVVINDVVLTSGAGANVKASLEIGGVTEQVTVSSTSEIVQTQSSTVSSTINTNQITKLPLTSRSAMDFVNFLPGVSTVNGNRQATINGLPRGTINITLDGVNVQDNTLRSTDGFFAIVSPRLDAIEEVTVTTAAQGADSAGQGAVQVKFVTRSGTNSFTGSGYDYYRRDGLNANTWFNNRDGVAKPKLKQDQAGFRVGGPIMLPRFNGRNKAFFFVNYEEFHQPSDVTRNRTILNPLAQQGIYRYTVNGVTQQVNLLALAAANGHIATADPTIGKLLGDIRSASGSTGSIADVDANLQRFTYNVQVESVRRFPTARIDYNFTDAHRFSSAFNYQKFTDFPDTLNNREAFFPDFPVDAGQASKRIGFSNSLRSTLGHDLVNEARVGYSGAPVLFFPELNLEMFNGTLANTQGFHLNFPTIGSALTAAGAVPSPQSRNATSVLIEDTVTWLKGAHSISMGGSFTQFSIWAKNSSLVPTITTGMLNTDPALGLFNAANFPGASAANLTAAQNLYAFLTGRVTQIGADARIDESSGKYVYEGTGMQRGRLREFGGYLQDQWRLRQNLTLNVGLRYDIQRPFYPLNSSYTFGDITNICGLSGAASSNSCNLFQAGNLPGVHPVFQQLTAGSEAYKVDYNNVAPSAGLAWTPRARPGILGKLMGADDFVVRGGYTRSFSRGGLNDFTGLFANNPGVTIQGPVTRNDSTGNLVNGGSVPVLFRDAFRLGPPAFNDTPVYPLVGSITNSISGFDPNIQVPYADSWQAGITRSLGKSMAVEVRYVGTRGYAGWNTLNYNEYNIVENGFLQEFRQAQANLKANIAAGPGAGCIGGITTLGCQNNFAYTGAPGTVPLPSFLAFFNAQRAANAGNAALYTGANWTNATFLGFLAPFNPQPYNFANPGSNGLMGSATFRANAAAAGLTPNYFVANPELLGGANVRTNLDRTKYNALQMELRRRYAQGLQFQLSYVLGNGENSVFTSLRRPLRMLRSAGDPGDLTHQFKSNVVYDLPFGRGRRWGGGANGLIDRVIGGWQIGVASRLQSGRLIDLGNVRLAGMSPRDVEKMFKLRFDDAGKQVYMWPQDVVDNTILAWNVSATSPTGYAGAAPSGRYFAPPNGPDCIEVAQPMTNVNNVPSSAAATNSFGDCGTGSLVVTGPMFQQHDIRFSKRTTIVGRTNIELAAELLNALNHPNFTPVAGITNGLFGTTLAPYQLTALTGQDTRRTVQLVLRFNW